MSPNSWLISLLWTQGEGPSIQWKVRQHLLPSHWKLPSLSSFQEPIKKLIRVANQWDNVPIKNLGKSKVTFPWVVGAPQPQCPLTPSYLGGVPLAALIGLAFGGRGRWNISHCWSICLQWWGAWKWHKEDEGREMNSLRNLTALPLATATLNHLVNQIAKVTFYSFCGQNEDLLPAGTHVAPFLHQKASREILK